MVVISKPVPCIYSPWTPVPPPQLLWSQVEVCHEVLPRHLFCQQVFVKGMRHVAERLFSRGINPYQHCQQCFSWNSDKAQSFSQPLIISQSLTNSSPCIHFQKSTDHWITITLSCLKCSPKSEPEGNRRQNYSEQNSALIKMETDGHGSDVSLDCGHWTIAIAFWFCKQRKHGNNFKDVAQQTFLRFHSFYWLKLMWMLCILGQPKRITICLQTIASAFKMWLLLLLLLLCCYYFGFL